MTNYKEDLVNNKAFIFDLDGIPAYPDNPLDEILGPVFGINKNDNFSSFGVTDRHQGVPKIGHLDPVAELADQDVVADQQGWFHGTGRDLEVLYHKGAAEEGNENGNDYRFCVFLNLRFGFSHNRQEFLFKVL